MDRNDILDAEEIVHTYSFDGPQPYSYEPAMLQGESLLQCRFHACQLE